MPNKRQHCVYADRRGVAMGENVLDSRKANKAADSFSMPFYVAPLAHPFPFLLSCQAAVNEAPVYSIVSLLSSRLCVRGCVCVSGYECAFSLRCCCYCLFFIFFTFFVGCSLSIDTKQKANWKVSRSHIFIAYFEAPLAQKQKANAVAK